MGIASRHAGAPFANGETLSGTDLETDISNVYAQVNGNLDNANVAAAAGIAGSKLADASITNAKMVADTLTISSMALSATEKYSVIYSQAIGTPLATTAWTNVEGMTASVTPGNVGDLILCEFVGMVTQTGGSVRERLSFRFSINGSAGATVMRFPCDPSETTTMRALWAYAATSTSVQTIIPQYFRPGSAQTTTWAGTGAEVSRFLLIRCIPVKV